MAEFVLGWWYFWSIFRVPNEWTGLRVFGFFVALGIFEIVRDFVFDVLLALFG